MALLFAGGSGVAGCAKGLASDDDDDDDDVVLLDSGTDPDGTLPPPDLDAGLDDDGDLPLPPDAAGIADAAEVPLDASETPDASSCTLQTIQLFTNAGFDTGPGGGWVEASSLGYPIITDEAVFGGGFLAQSAPFLAWLGGDVGLTDSMYEQIFIPAGATNLQISGFIAIGTTELDLGVPFDTATLQIRSSAGAVISTLAIWSNVDVSAAFTAIGFTPAGSFAGQTLRFHLESDNDLVDHTNFFFDSLALNVTVCQ